MTLGEQLAKAMVSKFGGTSIARFNLVKRYGFSKKDLDSWISDLKKPRKSQLEKLSYILQIDLVNLDAPPKKAKRTKSPGNPDTNFKTKIVKSHTKKPYLTSSKGLYCMRHFFNEKKLVYNNIEMAHFTGLFQHLYGKGLSQKGHDLFRAPLCTDCHGYFDKPNRKKSLDLALEFRMLVDLYLMQEFDNRRLIFVKYPTHAGQTFSTRRKD